MLVFIHNSRFLIKWNLEKAYGALLLLNTLNYCYSVTTPEISGYYYTQETTLSYYQIIDEFESLLSMIATKTGQLLIVGDSSIQNKTK